mmetsp:Transcript_110986/g.312919  ORF Transcript_110986/g.312919 Transcript_110986/m.312919 type:complete len:200 (+) Transcript_110986:561-1160(+)
MPAGLKHVALTPRPTKFTHPTGQASVPGSSALCVRNLFARRAPWRRARNRLALTCRSSTSADTKARDAGQESRRASHATSMALLCNGSRPRRVPKVLSAAAHCSAGKTLWHARRSSASLRLAMLQSSSWQAALGANSTPAVDNSAKPLAHGADGAALTRAGDSIAKRARSTDVVVPPFGRRVHPIEWIEFAGRKGFRDI